MSARKTTKFFADLVDAGVLGVPVGVEYDDGRGRPVRVEEVLSVGGSGEGEWLRARRSAFSLIPCLTPA